MRRHQLPSRLYTILSTFHQSPCTSMTMRAGSTLLRGISRQSGSSASRLYRITPPPPPPQCRSFLTRRSTSFYSHSYPPVTYSAEIPYVPPVPPGPESSSSSASAGTQGSSSDQPAGGKRKERKERYLESLMDKAGELSLRCE